MLMTINGEARALPDDEPDMPLLWALRDLLGLKGTKFGCGAAMCGACTVHIDGAAVRSCLLPISAVGKSSVTTIEGLTGPVAEAVQSAWIRGNVPQCGYCQSGQVMSAAALLERNSAPSRDEVDAAMAGNLCRCSTYSRIRQAIADAAEALAQ